MVLALPHLREALGERVVAWPKPVGRFLGYRLDADGNPTFLNEQGGVKVEETFEGVAGGLRRIVTWTPVPGFTPAIHHPPELAPTEGPAAAGRRVFTYLWK